MRELYIGYNLLFGMIAVGAVTIGLQCAGGWFLWELQKECSRLGTTQQPWLRGIIMKFEACYKLHLPVHNVSCFVDRYLQECRFHRISLTAWINIGICGAWIEGILFGFGTIVGVYYRTEIQVFWFYGIYTIVILLLIMGGDYFLQIHAKQKVVRVYLIDYLENTLQPRLENHYLYPEEEARYQREYFEEEPDSEIEERTEPAGEMQTEPVAGGWNENFLAGDLQEDRVELLEEILNEYF